MLFLCKGKVHSNFPYHIIYPDGEIWSTIKHSFLKATPKGKDGYLMLHLKDKHGLYKNVYVHRLVAELYIPNPDNLPEVNHKDENKLNPCAYNLEWCTPKYNSNYGNRLSKFYKPIIQYDLEGNFIKEWNSQKEIVDNCGYSQSFLSQCLHSDNPVAYGYLWRFKEVLL